MAGLCIRSATTEDAAEIARVHVDCWQETYTGPLADIMLTSFDVDVRCQMWASVLSDTESSPTTNVLVVEQDGRLVGFVACGDQRSADLASAGLNGEIGAIYILNKARGRGIGRLLMNQSAQTLIRRGKTGLALWVLAENLGARRFYERLGGKLSGERSQALGQVVLSEIAYGWSDLKEFTS